VINGGHNWPGPTTRGNPPWPPTSTPLRRSWSSGARMRGCR